MLCFWCMFKLEQQMTFLRDYLDLFHITNVSNKCVASTAEDWVCQMPANQISMKTETEMISQLIDCDNTDHWSVRKFSKQLPNISWVQLLKWGDLLIPFYFYNSKLNMFGLKRTDTNATPCHLSITWLSAAARIQTSLFSYLRSHTEL